MPRSAELPIAIWRLACLGASCGVHSLTVARLGLGHVSRLVGGVRALQRLELSGNALATLPGSLSTLPLVRHADLSHSRLAEVPRCVCDWPALEALDLSHNLLAALPSALGVCICLEELNISHNQIAALPAGIGHLHRLRALDASHNRLGALPPALLDLRGRELKQLHLAANASPPAALLVEAHIAGGAYVAVEFCTAARPSASLKGDSSRYLACFAGVCRAVAMLFDGALPVVANTTPEDTAEPPRPRSEGGLANGTATANLRAAPYREAAAALAAQAAAHFARIEQPPIAGEGHGAAAALAAQAAAHHAVVAHHAGVGSAATRGGGAHASFLTLPTAGAVARELPPAALAAAVELELKGAYPRLGAFEVALRTPGGLFVPLHSKIATRTFPSVHTLAAALLAALGQPADHVVLLHDTRQLHRAAAISSLPRIRRLIHMAGTPLLHAADERGATPLHIAARVGQPAAVSMLLRARAVLHATDGTGSTPLAQAAAAANAPCVRLLLEARARVDAADHAKMTPLFAAVACGSLECVQLLCAAGADPQVVDAKGRLPVALLGPPAGKPTALAPQIRELLDGAARGAPDGGSLADAAAVEAPPSERPDRPDSAPAATDDRQLVRFADHHAAPNAVVTETGVETGD